jgi:hypothetical protein
MTAFPLGLTLKQPACTLLAVVIVTAPAIAADGPYGDADLFELHKITCTGRVYNHGKEVVISPDIGPAYFVSLPLGQKILKVCPENNTDIECKVTGMAHKNIPDGTETGHHQFEKIVQVTKYPYRIKNETYTYACEIDGEHYGTREIHLARVDTQKNLLTWRGKTYGLTVEPECGKFGWHAEGNGTSFKFCTATKGVAGFYGGKDDGVTCTTFVND